MATNADYARLIHALYGLTGPMPVSFFARAAEPVRSAYEVRDLLRDPESATYRNNTLGVADPENDILSDGDGRDILGGVPLYRVTRDGFVVPEDCETDDVLDCGSFNAIDLAAKELDRDLATHGPRVISELPEYHCIPGAMVAAATTRHGSTAVGDGVVYLLDRDSRLPLRGPCARSYLIDGDAPAVRRAVARVAAGAGKPMSVAELADLLRDDPDFARALDEVAGPNGSIMLGLSSIRERRMLVEPKRCAAGYIRELVLAGKVEPRLSDLDEGGHTRFWLTP